MKVTLNTYGGLTGGVGTPPVAVDVESLDANERNELRRLVAAATEEREHALPATPRAQPAPDAQGYEITIEDEHGQPIVLEAADGSVPAEFAQLRKWLRAHGTTG